MANHTHTWWYDITPLRLDPYKVGSSSHVIHNRTQGCTFKHLQLCVLLLYRRTTGNLRPPLLSAEDTHKHKEHEHHYEACSDYWIKVWRYHQAGSRVVCPLLLDSSRTFFGNNLFIDCFYTDNNQRTLRVYYFLIDLISLRYTCLICTTIHNDMKQKT